MDYLTLISVPAIVSVTYAFIEILKKITKNSEKLLHFCPLIASIVGAISGVICFYFIPDIIAASNVVVAILIGAASGLAATGTNQTFKQILEALEESKNSEKNNR